VEARRRERGDGEGKKVNCSLRTQRFLEGQYTGCARDEDSRAWKDSVKKKDLANGRTGQARSATTNVKGKKGYGEKIRNIARGRKKSRPEVQTREQLKTHPGAFRPDRRESRKKLSKTLIEIKEEKKQFTKLKIGRSGERKENIQRDEVLVRQEAVTLVSERAS